MSEDKRCISCLNSFSEVNDENYCSRCVMRKKIDFEQLIFDFVIEEPFYGYISRYINKYPTDKIGTIGVAMAGINSINMLYNKGFMDQLQWVEKFEVLKHEFLHLIFDHLSPPNIDGSRYKVSTNAKLWNVAADWAINSLLDPNKLPEEGLYPGRHFIMTERLQKVLDEMDPEKKEEFLKDRQAISDFQASMPLKEAAEWYYAELLKNPDVSSKIIGNDVNAMIGSIDDHDDWYKNLSEDQKKYFKEKMKIILRDAVNKCEKEQRWGSVPSETRELLRSLLSNKVDWKNLLATFIGMCRASDKIRTIKRIDRKYPYIHSGVKRNRTSRIAIAIDESGSVSNEELELFFAELQNLSILVDFTVIPFDSAVNESKVFQWKKNQRITPERVSCGGTDFSVPTEWVNKRSKDFDGFIILTDGACFKPIDSRVRRAYIICPNRKLEFDTTDLVIQMS